MLKLIPQKMYFDSDDDFYKFCVVPVIVPKERISKDGTIIRSMDFNLSNEYHNAVKDGKMFIIKDPNSQICKHQAVSYRTITKPIENLEEYFGYEDK